MDYLRSLALAAFAILLLRVFNKLLGSWHRHLPFPPGPSPQLLVGNLRDLPKKHPRMTYTEWGARYGDLVHASVMGQHIVIVNSAKTANELFEKRAPIYSGRPFVPTAELLGFGFSTVMLPLGDKWRETRRMFQQHFRRDALQTYRPVHMNKIHQLLQGLLSSPQDFRELLKTLAAAIIMSTVYGYEVKPENDRFVTIAESAVKKISESFLPGVAIVNTFPVLRHLPLWMLGADFQCFAAECRQLTQEMQKLPFEFVKQNMRDGVDSKSAVAKLLKASEARGRSDEDTIQEVAATAYAAGADTLSPLFSLPWRSTLISKRRRKNEIDVVVDTHRLPEFNDRPSLPFVEALYREVMRWKPVVPLGIVHATTTDDIYNGYFIPKGATVISNIWAMTRDESVFPEPNRFNPDRFFTADGKLNDDDTVLAFGFGRRVCAGRHLADTTVWATIVSVLSTFNITKAKDAAGNEIDIDPQYSDTLISHPEPFVCSITPRSQTAKSLIQATVEIPVA
ncbi:O-methylsterigmatocystin oxidoreductase [Mycena venus]|uniref:O-methylsterigmatocystin oxidoreductase n=1 Tax=Mycena venus TaxID=2733690 RepID=A0A8H6YUR1_9AGAR|nr:O-methylsterigmatocystin oxidoreductase [Mycena venus]